MVFWFGDLNYRIESSIAALQVLGHAVSGELAFLVANDQLNTARETGAAFEGFHEGNAGWGRRGESVHIDAGFGGGLLWPGQMRMPYSSAERYRACDVAATFVVAVVLIASLWNNGNHRFAHPPGR